MEEYLQHELSVSASGIAKLKRNYPSVFQMSVPRVKSVVQYLSSLLENHGPKSKHNPVTKIVVDHPMLLQLDVVANLEPTSHFLCSSLEWTEKELAAVIKAIPGVLGLSIERNLRPTIHFLQTIVDGRIGISKCILKHPQILALSLRNLECKKDYFDDIDRRSEGGAHAEGRNTLAATILRGAPSAYSLSLERNIIPKVEYLDRLWGSHRRESDGGAGPSLSDNLRECPGLLTLSLEGNIVPTMSFYNMTGYVNLDAHGAPQSGAQCAKHTVRGRYIASSLYNRLLPRWHFLLREQEMRQRRDKSVASLTAPVATATNDPPPQKYTIPTRGTARKEVALPPLHLLAGASDEVFCCRMKLSLGDYLAFKKEAVPRLKFNTQFETWLKTGLEIR